jgi:hypothetical protein
MGTEDTRTAVNRCVAIGIDDSELPVLDVGGVTNDSVHRGSGGQSISQQSQKEWPKTWIRDVLCAGCADTGSSVRTSGRNGWTRR